MRPDILNILARASMGMDNNMNDLAMYKSIPGTFPEADYQKWMDSWVSMLPYLQEGIKDTDSLGNPMYDYKKAFLSGVNPSVANNFHYGSSAPDYTMLKSPEHPTAWMEHFVRETGINPDTLNPLDPRIMLFPKFFTEKRK